MLNNVEQLRCALVYCNQRRCRTPLALLCREHLAIETIKLLQARGKDTIGTQDVYAAMEGRHGETASAIRKVLKTVVKFEDEIIRRGNI